MRKLAAVTMILFMASMAYSAEKSKKPLKSKKKPAAVTENVEAKKSPAAPLTQEFKAGDKICYKYNPNNPAYFEMTVKNAAEKEIVVNSAIKGTKEARAPHEEKYTPEELKDFLGKVHRVKCE